jgi:hypothetical protein
MEILPGLLAPRGWNSTRMRPESSRPFQLTRRLTVQEGIGGCGPGLGGLSSLIRAGSANDSAGQMSAMIIGKICRPWRDFGWNCIMGGSAMHI